MDGMDATTETTADLLGLWGDLTRAATVVEADLRVRLAAASRTPDEVELLMQLAAAPEGRLRMVDVATVLHLGKSSVTRLIDRLATAGLVVRAACPSDRRVTYAGITAAGLVELEQAAPIFMAGLQERLGRPLDAAQVAALRGDLRRILAADDDASSRTADP